MMSVIGLLSWGSPVGKRNLRWEGFVEKVGFGPEWKSGGVMDDESGDNDRDELISGWGGEGKVKVNNNSATTMGSV